jgi:catechol 2,3-dioxygenase-like lactoylglutathione lyase family enzyme
MYRPRRDLSASNRHPSPGIEISSIPMPSTPALSGILETALHVDDIDRASRFYEDILGLARIGGDVRFRAYSVAKRDVLLLFKRGENSRPLTLPGGVIPPHGSSGQLHVAFSIVESDLEQWETHLAANSILIESRVRWPLGGRSVYFRDPDAHLLELATPGLWSIY